MKERVGWMLVCVGWAVFVGFVLATRRGPSPVAEPFEVGVQPTVEAGSGRPEIPEIDVSGRSTDEIVAVILQTPTLIRWDVAFAVGEQVGIEYGSDLAAIARIADALPAELGAVFYNGMGHTVEWDVVRVEAEEARIEAHIPMQHRSSAYMGVIIRYAMVHAGDPEDVVRFADDFGERHDIDPVDGVRIGVQRASLDDPGGALKQVALYPERYRKGMAEEIGWRVGSDIGVDPSLVIPLAERLDPLLRPRFAHGVCRAAWIPGQSLAGLVPLLTQLPDLEQNECIHAIAFSFSEAGGTTTAGRVATELGEPALVAQLETALAAYRSRCLGHLTPDLQGRAPGPCSAEGSPSPVPER